MLKRGGERGHPCFVPDLSEKALRFSPLSMKLTLGIFVDSLYQVGKFSLYGLLRFFF